MNRQEALREAARRIEVGEVRYDWSRMYSCNCGVLAQVVSKATVREVRRQTRSGAKPFFGVWNDWQKPGFALCPISKIPVGTIFHDLLSVGFSPADVGNLEICADPAVRARVRAEGDGDFFDYAEPHAVVLYMRAWADLLDEQEAPAQVEMKADPTARAALDRFATSDTNEPWMVRGLDGVLAAIGE